MAKLVGPLMSFGARGKLGGSLVYSAWKGINTARQLVTPANPRSPAQVAQRDLLALIVAAWRSVDIEQAVRTAWNKMAQLTGRPLSGFNLFSSQLVQLAAIDPAASIVSGVSDTGADTVNLSCVNLDDLAVGDEAGNFTILYGASPDALLNEATSALAAGVIAFDATAAGFTAADKIFVTVRKSTIGGESFDRCGILAITLT